MTYAESSSKVMLGPPSNVTQTRSFVETSLLLAGYAEVLDMPTCAIRAL